MTLPDERYRAVRQAEQLLRDLCDRSKTPRVPKTIRDRARGALRHYPNTWDLDRAAAAAPEVFVKHLDPLYKMIKQHDMQQRLEEEVGEDLRASLGLNAEGELDLEARQPYK
jgi:hypothetical protein